MNFFFDNTFAPGLARAMELVAKGAHHAKHVLDRYQSDTGDLVWIAEVGKWTEEWIILSGDRRIATNPQRRSALLESKRLTFFMPSGFPDLDRWEQASRSFRWFPKIAQRASHAGKHLAFDVKMNGAIEPFP